MPGNLRRHSAVVLEAGGNVSDIELRFDDRLAAVLRFQLRQRLRFFSDSLGEPEQNSPALLRRRLRPTLKRFFRCFHCRIDIRRSSLRRVCDHLFGRWVIDWKRLLIFALDEFPANEQLIGACCSLYRPWHKSSETRQPGYAPVTSSLAALLLRRAP